MTLENMNKLREKYRASIGQFYSGWLYMLFVLTVGISVIVYAILQTHQASWVEWLVFPVTMLFVNFAEYFAHRWLGHKKTKYGKLFYQRHSGDHHKRDLMIHKNLNITLPIFDILLTSFHLPKNWQNKK